MGLRDRLTEQSYVRHVIEYKYMGGTVKEEFSSYSDAQDEKKKLEKMAKKEPYTNIKYYTTTKKK